MPLRLRIHRVGLALNEVAVKRVLHVRRVAWRVEQQFGVGFVLGEQQLTLGTVGVVAEGRAERAE